MRFKGGIGPKLYYQYSFYFGLAASCLNLIAIVLWETLWHFLSILRQPVSLGIYLFQIKVLFNYFENFLLPSVIEVSYQLFEIPKLYVTAHFV